MFLVDITQTFYQFPIHDLVILTGHHICQSNPALNTCPEYMSERHLLWFLPQSQQVAKVRKYLWHSRPGVVAHTFHPIIQEAEAGRSLLQSEVQASQMSSTQ